MSSSDPQLAGLGLSSQSRKRPAETPSQSSEEQNKRAHVVLTEENNNPTSQSTCSLPELSLQIKWISSSGKSRVSEVALEEVKCSERGQPRLHGLHKRLWQRAFGEDGSSSSNAVSLGPDQYLKFGTSNECLNFPMDVVNTEFKLMAMHDGWQYCLHETGNADQTRRLEQGQPNMHVTIIEFESIARIIGHLGIRLHMVAYPVVAVNRVFLADTLLRLRSDPDYKGLLT